MTRGFFTVHDPVSLNTAQWDDVSVRVTRTSSVSFMRPPARDPSRHPARYLHGQEKVCSRGRALPQAMILGVLMEDNFLVPEGIF